jgi:hypothetical protein
MDKYNANSKVSNYSDFCNNWESEKEKLKKAKRSFTPNSDRQQFVRNSRTEYNPVTHKLTDYTQAEIDDMLNKMDELEESNEKKSEKSDSIEECPSFSEFNKAISELKKVTKKIHKELKKGTKSEIDDYIEKKIFGRDV